MHDIQFFEDRLRLTVGSKFEHNDYTGFEIQPSARALWNITGSHAIWGAVSRAVRTPSRADRTAVYNLRVFPADPRDPFGPTVVFSARGNPDFSSEEVLAWEMGYRMNVLGRLSLDAAGFYNQYQNIRGTRFIDPYTLEMTNDIEGDTYGFELAADGDLASWWRLKLAYTYLMLDFDGSDSPLQNENSRAIEGESPRHQVSVRSFMNLGERWTFDAWLRYVDDLSNQSVDAYTTLDLRLGWRPAENIELALVGQNLLDAQHAEFISEYIDVLSTEAPRSVYGQITWTF